MEPSWHAVRLRPMAPTRRHARDAPRRSIARRLDPVMAGLVDRHGPMPAAAAGGRRPPVRAAGRGHRLPAARRQGRGHDLGSGAGALRADGPLDPDGGAGRRPRPTCGGPGCPGAKTAADPRPGRPRGRRAPRAAPHGPAARRGRGRRAGRRTGDRPWTAQMFLIFALRRLDVWPTGDLRRAGRLRASPTGSASRRRRRCSTSWASRCGPTAAWRPGTAGGPSRRPA